MVLVSNTKVAQDKTATQPGDRTEHQGSAALHRGLTPLLRDLFTTSLLQASVPTCLKTATIIPVPNQSAIRPLRTTGVPDPGDAEGL